ncbi:hypothetical protein Tco_0172426 [Tanacetum coccineum]
MTHHQHTTLKPRKGKGKATYIDESPKKLVKASTKVRSDPDAIVLIPFEINGKLYQLTNTEIQAHMEMEERKEKASQQVKLLALSKLVLIKVVHEEATKAKVVPKALSSKKVGQEFLKIQDAEFKVLNREHSQKIKKAKELGHKRIDQYRWTTNSRLRPKKSMISTFIQTLNLNFGITEWDEMRDIIPKKKNKVVNDLMNLLSKKYERLRATPDELGIRPTFPALGQVLSLTLGKNRKIQEL